MGMKKDRKRIGVLCSDANPPNIIEFLTALQAMNNLLIDNILYAVNDGKRLDTTLASTKQHRYNMAKLAIKTYDPLITFTDLGDFGTKPVEKTIMSNGNERYRTDGEDYIFKLFDLNPTDKFTLVFITYIEYCRRVDDTGKDDTINKLLANIKEGLNGFNPDFHNIIALFVGNREDTPLEIEFDKHEQDLINNDIFNIEYMKSHSIKGIPTSPKALSSLLINALNSSKPEHLMLLGLDVYNYIKSNTDYHQQLMKTLSE